MDKDPLSGKIEDVTAEVADTPSNSDTTKRHTIDQTKRHTINQTDDETDHDNQAAQIDGVLCQFSLNTICKPSPLPVLPKPRNKLRVPTVRRNLRRVLNRGATSVKKRDPEMTLVSSTTTYSEREKNVVYQPTLRPGPKLYIFFSSFGMFFTPSYFVTIKLSFLSLLDVNHHDLGNCSKIP